VNDVMDCHEYLDTKYLQINYEAVRCVLWIALISTDVGAIHFNS
jgi:hypothetical protein